MRHSKDRILTTHAGSLSRPANLIALSKSIAAGEILNPFGRDSLLHLSVRLGRSSRAVRHYDAPERDVRGWMSRCNNSGKGATEIGHDQMRSKSRAAWETAARCATLAQEADDPEEREYYARLRHAWITLAKRCEFFSVSDVTDSEKF